MQILPVIDILNGIVVRGVAGRRDEYRPIRSLHCDSSEPLAIAQSLHRAFGFRRFYLADLDGILSRRPNLHLYQQLCAAGYDLLVDAGIRSADDAGTIPDSSMISLVAALETLAGPRALQELITQFGPGQIVFSLDLLNGRPHVAEESNWLATDVRAIAEEAVQCGVQKMIVLDLADVGTGTGGSTAELCRAILQRSPQLRLITGGGVRGIEDVQAWSTTGVSKLLVASALHDGRLTPSVLGGYV